MRGTGYGRFRRCGVLSIGVIVLLLVTGGGCVRLVDKLEENQAGTYTEMVPLCDALRKEEPFRTLIGAAVPRPGGDGGNCEWLPTETAGQVALKVETVLHQGPVIENTARHLRELINPNECSDSCRPETGERGFIDISVRWLGCGQATNAQAVRFFGVVQIANVIINVTLQTRWRVPAKRLPGLVTDPAGPLRVLFQTAYLAFTYNVTLPTPAPLRSTGARSACDR